MNAEEFVAKEFWAMQEQNIPRSTIVVGALELLKQPSQGFYPISYTRMNSYYPETMLSKDEIHFMKSLTPYYAISLIQNQNHKGIELIERTPLFYQFANIESTSPFQWSSQRYVVKENTPLFPRVLQSIYVLNKELISKKTVL